MCAQGVVQTRALGYNALSKQELDDEGHGVVKLHKKLLACLAIVAFLVRHLAE
jgi:hypothetical protein